jgi:DNA polymerase-3 subunit alpha
MSPQGKAGSHDTGGTKLAAFGERQKRHVEFQPIGVRAKKNGAAAREHAGLKPMRFVSLHHHSTFSFLDGFQMPEAHVRRITELKGNALAMCEHGNIFSHVKLESAAVKEGIKPIFGCEFYMGHVDEERRTQKKNHLTVVAKNAEGYQNLLTLVTRSWAEGFFHEPTVDWSWLEEHQKGLVILSGCSGSALFTALVGGKHVAEEDASYKRGLRVARWMSERFDDFYIEVQAFPELEKTRQANPMLAQIARVIRRPLVATLDCHYTIPEEAEVQKVLHGVRPGEKRTAEELAQSWGYDVPLCPPTTDKSIYQKLRDTGLTEGQAIQAIVSTEEIGQECAVELPKLPHVDYPLPDGYESARDLWRDWIKEGWRYRGCTDLPEEEWERYQKQLLREMEVMEAKGYENYFLIVSDLIKFMKQEQIPVGPARGSSAASLVCYLLRITEVDPMKYEYLVFERFIDWSREDMPDVDIDVATYGRPIVRHYLEEKYGKGCVNNVGTFTKYTSKNSLGDAARVHEVPKKEVEKVKELLLDRSSGDLRASATIEDTVNQFDQAYEVFERYPELQSAMDLEGNVRGFGIHAAGLVVSREPITNICAMLEREVPKGSGQIIQAISMDLKDAERQGMEKLDLLSLSTMDMIAEAMHLLDMSVEDLYAIPLDDEEVFDGFRENDVVGVFQFDGKITRTVNGVIKPDNFDEVALIIAIARPGPLHNGAVDGFVEVKYGDAAERESIHPALDRITEGTNYQIILQEQIIRIVREIGGFDWTGAAAIRKIIAKKKGEQEFNRKWDEFRKGALELHKREKGMPPMTEEVAKDIWMMCITSGAYAFNAAHAWAYGMISYWTMWLKIHHPAEFYAASLSKMKVNDADYQATLRRDAANHGIEVLPPDINSEATWTVAGAEAVRAGWAQIPGIKEKVANKIQKGIEEKGGIQSFSELIDVPGIGPKKIEAIEAFCSQEDPFKIYELDEQIEEITEQIVTGELALPVPTHSAPEILDAGSNERFVFLGQPIHRNLRDLEEANQKKGEEVDWDNIWKPELKQWVVMRVRDADELIICIVGRAKYPDFKEAIWNMRLGEDLVLLECKKGDFGGSGERSGVVFVDRMTVIEP